MAVFMLGVMLVKGMKDIHGQSDFVKIMIVSRLESSKEVAVVVVKYVARE